MHTDTMSPLQFLNIKATFLMTPLVFFSEAIFKSKVESTVFLNDQKESNSLYNMLLAPL